MKDKYIIMSEIKEKKLTSKEIDYLLKQIPENSQMTYGIGIALSNKENITTNHFIVLVEKSSPEALVELANHIPYKKLAGEGTNKELNQLSDLTLKMYDKCLKDCDCKKNAKCSDNCKIQDSCPKHPLTTLVRNIRKELISKFNLNILKIDDTITGIICSDLPKHYFKTIKRPSFEKQSKVPEEYIATPA